jgi:nucleoside-diphosphate-sugar epimerase
MDWKSKNILVAGGAGMIGSHVARRLVKEGANVTVVDDLSSGSRQNIADIAKEITFYQYDLRDANVCRAVCEGKFAVFVFAANMGGILAITSIHANIARDNALININMLEGCRIRQVPHVYLASSACVYPSFLQTSAWSMKLKESMAIPSDPNEAYGWEKLFSEQLALAYIEDYGMNIKIGRQHNVYGHCYDEETQVLTRKGFKYFSELAYSDEIATLNQVDDKVEYYIPEAIQHFEYDGDMLHFKHRMMDLMCTPDQKLYCGKNFRHKYGLHIGSEIIKGNHRSLKFKLDFPYTSSKDIDSITLPRCIDTIGRKLHNGNGDEKVVAIDDWLEFLGWYISEGSCFQTDRNYIVNISQKPGDSQEQIKRMFTRMGFPTYTFDKDVRVHSKQLYGVIKSLNLGYARDKYIPREYMELPTEKLRILYDTLMLGDGDKGKGRYSTVSYRLACDVQELALKIGLTSQIKYESNIYRVMIRANDCTYSGNGFHTEHYKGMVYDVTVPNHIIMVKRNSNPIWSGNCYTAFDNLRGKAPCHMIRKAIEHPNPEFVIWGDGEQTRSFLYIDDCVEMVLRLMQTDYKKPINIGTEQGVTINYLADLAIKASGKQIKPIYDLTKPQGVRGRNSDNTLFREVVGYEPQVTLEEGIPKVYEWALSNYDRLEGIH